MAVLLGFAHDVRMAKKLKGPRHHIRAWRKHRDFTLERLAARVGTTHATLSRIERGKQPYSQELLEALAEALGTTPASLIMRDPTQKDAIWDLWDSIPEPDRAKATQMLEIFTKKTGTGG